MVRRRILYLRILEGVLLLIALWVVLPLIASLLMSPKFLSRDDFLEYWAAGRLNAAGQNPYDPNLTYPLQRAMGHMQGMMMWNPPWTLALTMPLGFLPYPVARTLWFFLQLVAVVWSSDRIGHLTQGGTSRRWIAWFIGLTFYPFMSGMNDGQVTPIILIGAVGAFIWIKRYPLLAGATAALLTIKPHTNYLILLALVVWAFTQKRWSFFLGFGGALLGSLAIAMAFNPAVVIQYLNAWTRYPPTEWATPTIGGLLRLCLGPEHFALQLVGSLVGLSWLAFYGARRRNRWVWEEEFPLIAVVSPVTAAYGWISDLLPALIGLLPAVLRLLVAPRSRTAMVLLASYGLLQAIVFITAFDQLWYFWLGPALLLWFLLARRHLGGSLLRREDADETAH